ncbi:MAG: histidinol dehydrogenase [Candidatus Electrothrix sp. AW2]|nr:histidinol dehydrogenase [Candidatus Electrothrix gigas]
MTIRIENYATDQGKKSMDSLRDRFALADSNCAQTVTDILDQVRNRGDEAVLEYTRRFDAPELSLEAFKVSEEEFDQAAESVDEDFMATLSFAAERIRLFHEREMEDSWMMTRDDGTITGRLVRPVDSAGLYVPGGQGGSTPLVSSVLMNAIPAGIAGVQQRIMMTPPNKDGKIAPALLMAAKEVGITEVYKAGSAWAIAALAFGTESVPAADVIVGPGNQFVTEAKRQVMGKVRIDMIAGPSEVLIVADQAANPAYIAADMLAQAEHDPMALALLLTTETSVAEAVKVELEKQLPNLIREDIARTSLQQRGLILVVENVEQGVQLANEIAIEHLELQVEDPWQWLPMIKHAGAIFLGAHTPEAAGDYVAGPNHVLPTMGTARISSALGVETFLKKSSIISYSRQALLNDAEHIQRLANLEGLSAHANSVAVRVK